MMQFDLFAFFQSIPEEIQLAIYRYLIALVLLVVLIIVTKWKRIGIRKKLVVGSIRGTVQIVLFATIIQLVFALQDLILIFGLLSVMCVAGAHTARTNLPEIPGVMNASLPGIWLGTVAVMGFAVILQAVPPIGEFIIPMGGMLIGQSMGLSSQVIERMWSLGKKQRVQLETALSLGASPKQAMDNTITESIEAGLLPALNRFAALGIVSIPGLMSGMIIGGADPIAAAFYQVMIFFLIFLAAVSDSLIASRVFLKEMFNEDLQLTVPVE